VTDFSTLVNTCCATRAVPTVSRFGCSGPAYTAGPAVVFRIHPIVFSHINLTASGGDAQIMVFTDCSNPVGSCVASSDTSEVNSEQIENLALQPGIYFISVSRFNNDCGDIAVHIQSDEMLPAELTSFDATPGRNAVSLSWQTSSETGNDRFEIERDGLKVGVLRSQGNGPTGHRYTWAETGLENGRTYRYDLYSVGLSGARILLRSVETAPRADADALITDYSLFQNYPNPFNPVTQIAFDLLERGQVSLRIYNLLGQRVAEPVNDVLSSGHHVLSFDAAQLPSGVYIYRLEVNAYVAEKKMLLMK
jgi:hypothetical protein